MGAYQRIKKKRESVVPLATMTPTRDYFLALIENNLYLVAIMTAAVAMAGHYLLHRFLARPSRVLDEETFRAFPLISIAQVSHNSKILRFGLPSPDATLGLPLGRHISLRVFLSETTGEAVTRPYTPISGMHDRGFFDLLVKVYPDGKMTQVLDKMKIGQTLEVRGPKGSFQYVPGKVRFFGMIAGGSGITPMWQILSELLREESRDPVRIALIYANETEDDILMRKEMEALAEKHGQSGQFRMYFVLNKPLDGWKGGRGFVSEDMIRSEIGKPESEKLVLLCGPPAMNKAMRGHLTRLGYDEESIFRF